MTGVEECILRSPLLGLSNLEVCMIRDVVEQNGSRDTGRIAYWPTDDIRLKMTNETSAFRALNCFIGKLNPTECKLALRLWARVSESGADSVELSIEELARDTGLCPRTVHKYSRTLVRKGVVRLLSKGRSRSRYALPVDVVLHEREPNGVTASVAPTVPAVPSVPPMSVDDEIAALLADLAVPGWKGDLLFTAEQIAGGKDDFRKYLRIIRGNSRGQLSMESIVSRIDHLTYQTGRPAKPGMILHAQTPRRSGFFKSSCTVCLTEITAQRLQEHESTLNN